MFNKKLQGLTTPTAIIIAGLLISFSVFFTTLFFFGGANNRTKLFLSNPSRPSLPVNPTNSFFQQQQQTLPPIATSSKSKK